MLNYPVDLSKKYVLYNIATQKAERVKIDWPRPDGGEIVGLDKNFTYLLYEEAEKPIFSSEEQLKKQIVIDLKQNKYSVNWEIIAKEKSSEKIFQEKISAGFLVEPEGFILGLKTEDQNAFANLLTLMNLSGVGNDYLLSIADKNGDLVSVTFERFKQIIISYGIYYQNLWKNSKI
jgi:hypothetical protein